MEVSRCVDGDYRRPEAAAVESLDPKCTGAAEGVECWKALANKSGCYVWDTHYFPDQTVTWSGACSLGVTTGKGTLIFTKDGRANEGTGTMLDGKPHGHWAIRWPDGSRYEGEVRDYAYHGQGIRTWTDGARYEGEWGDGKPHGQGIYISADGDRYAGQWVNGCYGERMALGYWINTTAEACGFCQDLADRERALDREWEDLVRRGAQVLARERGISPSEISARYSNWEIVELGADIDRYFAYQDRAQEFEYDRDICKID